MADKKISQLTGASTPLAGTEVLPIVQSGATVKVSAADVTAGRAVSALTYTSTATTGTAPFTVASTTEVANLRSATATSANQANAVKSNATTGVLEVAGPATAATRVMTVPDANFTVARTDAANSFTGIQTLATENLVVGTSGKGIDFSATAHAAGMTSELFSDYEEGTWTPEFAPETGAFTSITYNIQNGYYTKIGRLVFISFALRTNSITVGTAADGLRVSGLPFTVGGFSQSTLYVPQSENWGGDYPQAGFFRGSTNLISLFYKTSLNSASVGVQVSDLGTGASANEIGAAGFYIV